MKKYAKENNIEADLWLSIESEVAEKTSYRELTRENIKKLTNNEEE